jgi:hypothetical protein
VDRAVLGAIIQTEIAMGHRGSTKNNAAGHHRPGGVLVYFA